MRKYLTIGEMSKVLGISTSKIRYYEREGLVKPVEISEGGYRLYDYKEMDQLETIIIFRNLGLSIETIKSYYVEYSKDSYRELLNMAKEQLKSKVDELEVMSKQINRRLEDLNATNDDYWEVSIKEIEDRDVKIITEKEFIDINIKEAFDIGEVLSLNINELYKETIAFVTGNVFKKVGVINDTLPEEVIIERVTIPKGRYLELSFLTSISNDDGDDEFFWKHIHDFKEYARVHNLQIDDTFLMFENKERSMVTVNVIALFVQVRLLT